MVDWLPPAPLFVTFLVASFVLAVTPGPGVLFRLLAVVSGSRAKRS